MNKKELIESTKIINSINHEVEKEIELESDHVCMICKNEVSSFCKSHSIPHAVFNHMNLENGEVIPFFNATRKEIMTKVEKGKNNSGIFKLICNECDQKYFSLLDNFDLINEKWDNKLLNLQAQRINLFYIYRIKEHSYTLYKMYESQLTKERIENDKKYVQDQIKYYKELFNKYNNDDSIKFNILFDEVLDYETNFTVVSNLSMIFNPCLDIMIANDIVDTLKFESHELEPDKFFTICHLDKIHNNDMYVVVLPYNGKTRVTLFCDSNSICNVIVKNDFDSINRDNILLYISSALIISGRNIYGNQKFMKEYRKAGEIFKKQFSKKYNGKDYPQLSTFDIKEQYLYIYDNDINLFKL